jgi:hypothetical protein
MDYITNDKAENKEEKGTCSRVTTTSDTYPDPFTGLNQTVTQRSSGEIPMFSRVRHWKSIQGWKTVRLEDNFVPPDHPFDITELRRSGGSGRTTVTRLPLPNGGHRRQEIRESALYVAPFPGFPPGIPNLRAIVEAEAIDKAKGEQWNAPVFVAEAHKTVNMVVSRATQLVDILRDLRRGRIKRAIDNIVDHRPETLDRIDRKGVIRRYNHNYGKNAPKAAGNAWLELQYGWTPALADVENAATLLAEKLETKRDFSTIRVKTKAGRQFIVQEKYSNPTPFNALTKRIYEVDHSARYVWRLRLGLLNIPGQLGLLNPALIAWELVPFSFVADWFFPVGDWLETLDADMRFFHLGGSYTTRTKINLTEVYSYSSPSTTVSGLGSGSRMSLVRTPVTEVPNPSYADFPSKLGLIGGKRAVSAIALLQQNVRYMR